MASVRFIKKCVKALTNDLMTECVIYRYYHADQQLEKSNNAMETLVAKHRELIDQINGAKKTDYKKNKAYFNSIIAEMKKMPAILDALE
jgi:seryl-tRNA synthetase